MTQRTYPVPYKCATVCLCVCVCVCVCVCTTFIHSILSNNKKRMFMYKLRLKPISIKIIYKY